MIIISKVVVMKLSNFAYGMKTMNLIMLKKVGCLKVGMIVFYYPLTKLGLGFMHLIHTLLIF